MRYGSVCSGIEAASVAWGPLGWTPEFFAEIERFPSEVLAARYGANLPGEPLSRNAPPNLGDITNFMEWPDAAFDVLVGGTPCQSFSVAGLRAGLADPRGDLTLTYAAIARRYRPRWMVWENVPGVLSDDGGRSFASLLGLLAGRRVEVPHGGWRSSGIVGGYARAYGLAWRVLDAQYVRVDGLGRAVPQRRRRVFVVGYLGDWRRAAAVLLERESLSGNPAPRREARKVVAATVAGGARGRGGYSTDDIPLTAHTLSAARGEAATHAADFETYLPVAGGGPDGGRISGAVSAKWSKGTGGPAGDEVQNLLAAPPVAATLTRGAESAGKGGYAGRRQEDDHNIVALPFDTTQVTHPANRSNPQPGDPCHPLPAHGHPPAIAYGLRNDASRSGEAATPSADAEGRVRLRDAGFNIYEEHSPTLDATAPHTVAFGIDSDALDRSGEGAAQNAAERAGLGVVEGFSPALRSKRPNAVAHGWAVRRLTPLECERLQGFPEIRKSLKVIVCEDESNEPASSAPQSSQARKPDQNAPVVAHVLINCERREVEIHRAGRLLWSNLSYLCFDSFFVYQVYD